MAAPPCLEKWSHGQRLRCAWLPVAPGGASSRGGAGGACGGPGKCSCWCLANSAVDAQVWPQMTVTDPHINSEKRGALGLLTLNRPQALNALTRGMIKAIAARLAEWAGDAEVRCVAIRGAGMRGFCAGGDIRAVQQAVVAGSDEGADLLRDEYHMNALIGAYPKPYLALLHGITMGGGAGLSVHGRYRLADASLSFAMPETGIGFIPDVGGGYFLSRVPDEMGMYMGLTANAIGLADGIGGEAH